MTQKLWIMRHGDAPYIEGRRALSATGYEQSKATSLELFSSLLKQTADGSNLPTAIWASPLIRAEQTAQAVLEAFSIVSGEADEPYQARLSKALSNIQLSSEKELSPEGNVAMLIEIIEASAINENLLLASHMPLVSNLLHALCPNIQRFFETSNIVELDCVLDDVGNRTYVLSRVVSI